jgi:beta-lactamase regulating signal transducer with metallopeptidase domain
MSPIGLLSRDPIFHRLGGTLIQFLWQGAIVAAVNALVRAILPRSKPAARYAAGCAALGAMLILPAATFWRGPEQVQFVAGTRSAIARIVQTLPTNISIPAASLRTGAAGLSATLRQRAGALEPWLVLLWAAGVALLSARFLFGWAAVERLRNRWAAEAPAALSATVNELARRLRVARPVRLLQSGAVRVPTALGVVKPLILLPLSSLSGLSPSEIEAVLAHEVAHIRRHDYLVNLLQTAAETLLFYHPAVWWVSGRVRADRESCCDDLAVAATGDAGRYARALLRLEETRAGASLLLAASGGPLWSRITRLLPASSGESVVARSAAALLALTALVTLGAAARLPIVTDAVPEAAAPASAAGRPTSADPASPSASPVACTAAAEAAAQAAAVETVSEQAADEADASDAEDAEDVLSPEESTPEEPSENPKAITAEQLAAFRTNGVTPEFLRAIQALGYTHASADTLISLRVHGVEPDFIRESNELFGERLTLDRCVSLRIHGVTPQYLREMFSVVGRISPEEAEALGVHGVSAQFVSGFREAGYGPLSAQEAITLRTHGIDPRVAEQLARLGLAKPSLNELLSAQNHGVSVEYVRGVREAGLTEATLEELTQLRTHGVTAEFVRSMRSQGFPKLSAEEAVSLRNHGVAPEFVRDLGSLGYSGLSVDELVSLRNHGVTTEFVRKANASARVRLSVDQLIERRIRGKEQQ